MTVSYRFGFDIGGTFTDFVMIDQTGRMETYKTLTTPSDPSRAVNEGFNVLLDRMGATGANVETAIHATTLITNALIERKGSRTALITTFGHSDVLEMAKEMRYDIYDLLLVLPEPLVPRALRHEVEERLNGRGEVVIPLSESDVQQIIAKLKTQDVKAAAVCFLHSYQNATHEKRTGEMLKEALPELRVSLSSEVAPEIREYDRMSTAVANAYVQPMTAVYVERLEQDLRDSGFKRRMYLMLSSGGITTGETAAKFPIRLLESGPAAGVLATVYYGEQIGTKELVAFDMGGTTAKMCLIRNGKPTLTNNFEIARVHRFKRGSGLPVRIPTIELIEIGAGGGSIAWVDDIGLLKVGPQSSGADPGPACYGQGGTQPTVTDADLILGYLNPDYFLGGRMKLIVEAARRAMQPLADRLGRTVEEAAYGIYQIVNENMISATRVHVAERAADTRRLTLLAFGGAGPVHADPIARTLKMKGYICPGNAGITSALGLLTAPAAFDISKTYIARITQEKLAEIDHAFIALEEEGRARLSEAGVFAADMVLERSIDVRHRGQGHEIVVRLPDVLLANMDLTTDLRPLFFEQYEAIYGHAHFHLELEVMTIRLRATGPRPVVDLPRAVAAGGASALKGERPAYVPEQGSFVLAPVYDRDLLSAGTEVKGPAIVEERNSTAFVGAGAVAQVDEYLNLIVSFQPE